MFGNTLSYYSGPGGVRRGIIWQSGKETEPEWITPVREYVRGTVDGGKLWGNFIFGGIQAIQKITEDTDPVTTIWQHDPGPVTVYYNRRKKIIKYDYEWDRLANTPSDVLNASQWTFAPDYQPASGYIGSVWLKWDGTTFSSLPSLFPIFNAYRYSDGSGWTIQTGSRISWNGDPWSAANYPFPDLRQIDSAQFNSWNARYYIDGAGITVYNISAPILMINPRSPANSYPYRIAEVAVIAGNCTRSAAPRYYRGPWQFTLKNAIFPEWAFLNLTNTY